MAHVTRIVKGVKKAAARAAKDDGRSTRWSAHREARRAELVLAAVAAIDEHGPGAGIEPRQPQIVNRIGYSLQKITTTPKEPMARPGLHVAQSSPNVVYLVTEYPTAGTLFRSDDYGETWEELESKRENARDAREEVQEILDEIDELEEFRPEIQDWEDLRVTVVSVPAGTDFGPVDEWYDESELREALDKAGAGSAEDRAKALEQVAKSTGAPTARNARYMTAAASSSTSGSPDHPCACHRPMRPGCPTAPSCPLHARRC